MKSRVRTKGGPSGRYVTHSVIDKGRDDGLALGKNNADTARELNCQDILDAILTDGAPVNTGCRNGAIPSTERELGRSLQRLVCQLHRYECPMCHVFEYLDGGLGTSVSNSFKGPMGQNLTSVDVHKQDPVDFQPIKSNLVPLPDDTVNNISRDQKVLYKYTIAIDSGNLNSKLAKQSPPAINHARWLTLCLKALLDYTRDSHLSSEKILFIKYIQEVYAPSLIHIKSHETLENGSKNVFYAMSLIRKLPKDVNIFAKK